MIFVSESIIPSLMGFERTVMFFGLTSRKYFSSLRVVRI